jgi:hypothetical protein
MRWAVVHGGDQELFDLLGLESDRLFAMIGQSHSQGKAAPSRFIEVEAILAQPRQ